jgi:predicted SAM-dependent methyltransferase
LEHYSKLEGQTLLQECRRVLKKGGIIRIVVPDLKSFIEMYNNGKMRADDFVENLGVLYEKKNNPIKNLLITIMQFPHKCMYDSETLLNIMNSLGFDVENKQPFESNILDINNLELAERTEKAVIIEGIKR